MSTQPQRPEPIDDFDQETLKRIYDEHVDAAEKETVRVSRQELLADGLRKLKLRSPQ